MLFILSLFLCKITGVESMSRDGVPLSFKVYMEQMRRSYVSCRLPGMDAKRIY